MSLIPMLLSRFSAAPVTTPAGSAGRYDPGAGHRPVAAIVAVALPAALLVAVALSPFELPVLKTYGETIIETTLDPIDPPPPDPAPQPQQPTAGQTRTVPTPLPPIGDSPPADPPIERPIDTGPIAGPGEGTETPPLPIPTPPPLIAAKPDPRFAGSFQPDYPAFEQRNEVEGMARVRVLIGTDGRVKAVEDAGSSSSGFFNETKRRALAKWRFTPATRGGVAEESWTIMTVKFRLES